jgi:sugar/nucleoside kinase (ribokinase family)
VNVQRMEAAFDVVGVGNAIVDVLAAADDAFLHERGMVKGAMALIDRDAARAVYEAMGPTVTASGGSAANTIAGIASLGGKAGFIGKVRDDDLGRAFRHDIAAAGVAFPTPPATQGPPTAICLVLVTPDSQRTLNTYLGASVELTEHDIDAPLIESAQITYLEGYLYDAPAARRAFARAAEIAHAAGRRVALTLSDPFCVQRHREAFLELVDGHVDVLFANAEELRALFLTGDVDAAVEAVRPLTHVAAVTRGPEGSTIVCGAETLHVSAIPTTVVDTTGAGDLYAAGFLYGLTNGAPLEECGRYGSAAAAEAISHFGARPQRDLRAVVGAL